VVVCPATTSCSPKATNQLWLTPVIAVTRIKRAFWFAPRLRGRALHTIINAHLHSDHCDGNTVLLGDYPAARLLIPPGHADQVKQWDTDALSYVPTGQTCPRFLHRDVLHSGETIRLARCDWEIHGAPGHDPHSVILFEPSLHTLISADALWNNGFGVVFQELEGIEAFDEVAATLDLIERLLPLRVIPGHGTVFVDVDEALARARSNVCARSHSPCHLWCEGTDQVQIARIGVDPFPRTVRGS
jgi:glyoxylase-like metal-dependent hydrolase (beta-lactamase superfamily II)